MHKPQRNSEDRKKVLAARRDRQNERDTRIPVERENKRLADEAAALKAVEDASKPVGDFVYETVDTSVTAEATA